jgi:hypothetical protein
MNGSLMKMSRELHLKPLFRGKSGLLHNENKHIEQCLSLYLDICRSLFFQLSINCQALCIASDQVAGRVRSTLVATMNLLWHAQHAGSKLATSTKCPGMRIWLVPSTMSNSKESNVHRMKQVNNSSRKPRKSAQILIAESMSRRSPVATILRVSTIFDIMWTHANAFPKGKKCGYEFCWLCFVNYNLIRSRGNVAHALDCKHHRP